MGNDAKVLGSNWSHYEHENYDRVSRNSLDSMACNITLKIMTMTLRDVKAWIETLPAEFLEYSVVNSEEKDFPGDENYVIRLDRPIVALGVDEDNTEILLFSEPPPETPEEEKIY